MAATQDSPILTLVNALRSGVLSLDKYIEQLEARFSEREAAIQAFVVESNRFDRLRVDAKRLIERYPNPINRPPLFGLPVGIKDIFHVDGFSTRAGSNLPEEVLQGKEAQVVGLLKEAGALIFGKAVTTEFAYFGPGPTRNPHNPDHTPGGSSSGSAAAVAAGLCPLATGTQTIGSINRPAAYCGIVGYKPSYDRISRSGVIPLSPSLDHIGVFAGSVAGVELVASLLCPDWQLAVTDRKPVLGVPEGPYLGNASKEGLNDFQLASERLKDAGCQVKNIGAMPDFDDIANRHQLIVAAEAAQVHADWFAQYDELYHEKTRELILRGRSVSVGDLAEALTGRKALRRQLSSLMDEHRLDLWISPAAPGPAPKGIESTGNPIMNLPWTHAGLPTVTLPSGKSDNGLPLGLQVSGRWYEDEALLEWSAHLEMILRDGAGDR